MDIVKTEGLTKTFGDTVAVNNVSLHVKQGEIYGFLGLNGAGKTTAIRMMLGLIKSESGHCELFGQRPKQAIDIWNDIGYLIETPHGYPNLSVVENLEVVAKLRGISDKNFIDRIIEQLRLTPYKNKKEEDLSLGNKQRLGLAKALMHKPKLLILDEPINGLDPAGIVEVRELLKELSENHGTTIFLSSHILSEIAKITSRIGIIHQGSLIKEIDSADLKKEINKKLQINTPDNEKAAVLLKEKGFPVKSHDGLLETFAQEAIDKPENISGLLAQSQLPPKMLAVSEENLEEYFLRTIKEEA